VRQRTGGRQQENNHRPWPKERTVLRRSEFLPRHVATTSAILVAVLSSSVGSAAAADVFAGKPIRIVIPAETAGSYRLYAQLAVQHLGRFIPGNPTIVISYMPGASGFNAMNYLYAVAPRDGTVLAVLFQDLASQQALGTKGVRFDATKFNYIGRATANVPVHMVWHTAPAKSIDELKKREVVTGAAGTGGIHNDLPRAQNALIGTKWKIIAGYRGGNELRIAMERGEIQAAVAAATLFNEQLRPWLEQGKVKIVVQYADFRHPEFPDVPAIVELAENQEAKEVFKFLVSYSTIGRAYAAPPGVPATTVDILRKAFTAMINDPAFRADAEKRGADLLPMPGEELAAYVAGIVRTPSDIIRKTNEVIAAK
jgi:tripartite-type tricarboxylate transporter receptor subunit TctC